MNKKITFITFITLAVVLLFSAVPVSAATAEKEPYITSAKELNTALSRRDSVVYLDNIVFEDSATITVNYSVKFTGKKEKSVLKNVHFLVDGAINSQDMIKVEFENIVFDGGFDTKSIDRSKFGDDKYFSDIYGSERNNKRCINTEGYFDLTFNGCDFTRYAAETGAVLYIDNPTTFVDKKMLQMTDCRFYDNLSQYGTVFVFFDNLKSMVRNCEFYENYAGCAAGMNIANGRMELDGVKIHNNHFLPYKINPDNLGGGLSIGGALVTVKNSEIINNETIYGGGISVVSAQSGDKRTVFENCKIANNKATYGGGVHVSSLVGQPIYFINCTFAGNTAKQGGALYTVPYAPWTGKYAGGLLEFSFCTFENNTAEDNKEFEFYELEKPENAGAISLFGCVVSDDTTLTGNGEAPNYTLVGKDLSEAEKQKVPKDGYQVWAGGMLSEMKGSIPIGANSTLKSVFSPESDVASRNRITVTTIYGLFALASLVMLIYYCVFGKETHLWMALMLVSVFVTQLGYLTFSLSGNLEEALLANRISYFGNAFFPLFFLFTMANICRFHVRKIVNWGFAIVSFVMFLIAVRAGYSEFFYSKVSFEIVDGISTLYKEYDIHHTMYTVYIFVYYFISVALVLYSIFVKRLAFFRYVVSILAVISANLLFWIIDKIVDWHFEFLSISYVISMFLLIMIYSQMAENGLLDSFKTVIRSPIRDAKPADPASSDNMAEEMPEVNEELVSEEDLKAICDYLSGQTLLTKREIEVLILILRGGKRSDIADTLFITENTIKTHIAHIYTKLGVKDRLELPDKLSEMMSVTQQ